MVGPKRPHNLTDCPWSSELALRVGSTRRQGLAVEHLGKSPT